jgi:hypothetical protein
MNACDGLTWRAFGWRFGLPVGLFVLETPPTNTFPLHGNGFPWLQNPPRRQPPCARLVLVGVEFAHQPNITYAVTGSSYRERAQPLGAAPVVRPKAAGMVATLVAEHSDKQTTFAKGSLRTNEPRPAR